MGEPSFRKRFCAMLAGVLGMGIFISLLLAVGYGTDTSSFLNSSLSQRLGISLGPVMVTVNIIMFILQLLWGRRLIGIGTICNMCLIGPTADLCGMLLESLLPPGLLLTQPLRALVFIIALALFLICAALYMNSELGLAPYDALPRMASDLTGLPFAPVRMVWDALAIIIGIAAGGSLTIGTVVLALTLGPAVAAIGRLMRR